MEIPPTAERDREIPLLFSFCSPFDLLNLAIPFLGIYSGEKCVCVHEESCTNMFFTMIFEIT